MTTTRPVGRWEHKLAKGGSQPHMIAATTILAEMPLPIGNGEKSAVVAPLKEIPAASPSREITVQSIVKDALTKELGNFRAQIEIHVREAIAEAVKTSLDEKASLAIEKILEQSNASISAIMEQAQKAARELAEKFDEKIRIGMEGAAIAAESETAATPKPRAPRKGSKRKAKTDDAAQEA